MHELPVVQELIKIVNSEAEQKNLRQVKEITLVVGELSSVIDESVQMYFELLAQDTVCKDAILSFEHRPAMLKCEKCGNEFEHKRIFDCPKCGGLGILIKGTGRELYIKTINGE